MSGPLIPRGSPRAAPGREGHPTWMTELAEMVRVFSPRLRRSELAYDMGLSVRAFLVMGLNSFMVGRTYVMWCFLRTAP